VHTSRGRFYADWTTEALVARERQLIFFSSFCRREDAQKGFGASVCALTYTGNRGRGAEADRDDIVERSQRVLDIRPHERGDA